MPIDRLPGSVNVYNDFEREAFDKINEVVESANGNLYSGLFYQFIDDWLYVGPMYVTFAGTSGTPVGHHTLTMTGSARLVGLTGTGRLGLVALQCGETADGQCRVHTCACGAFDAGGQANMDWISYEAVLAFEAKASVAEDYVAEVGLVGNAPGYGAFFRYNRAVGGHKWMAVTENEGTETAVVLDGTTQGGVTTVDTTAIDNMSLPTYGFYRLKVVLQGTNGVATSASFYVNGTLVATLTTNLPTHSLAGSVEILKTAGTTSRYIALDYTALTYQFLTARVP